MRITLEKDAEFVSPHRMRYAILRPKKPLPLPAATTNLGAWVWGNGVAKVDFEITDASGRRWHTIPPKSSYGIGLGYREKNAFDGWRFLSFQFPKRWRVLEAEGHGEPNPPVSITGVVLEQYEKVPYLDQLVAPPVNSWKLGQIVAQ